MKPFNGFVQRGRVVGWGIAMGGLVLFVLLLGVGFVLRIFYGPADPHREENPSRLVGEVIQIEVRNGCGVAGVARQVTAYLRSRGFDVVESGNFEHFNVEKTQVIARTKSIDAARKVAEQLGVDAVAVSQEIAPDLYLDVTVVIGKNYPQLKPFKKGLNEYVQWP